MKEKRRKTDRDEYELLVKKEVNSYIDNSHHQRQSSPFDSSQASWTRWLSVLCWWWVNPLLSLSYKRPLNDQDLVDLPQTDRCSVLYNRIQTYDWTKMTSLRVTIQAFWKQISLIIVPLLLYTTVRMAQPLILYRIIVHLKHHEWLSKPTSIGYFYAITLSICMLVQPFISQQILFYSNRVGLMIRNSLTSVIYARLLSSSMASLQKVTTTQMVNLISNDLTKLDDTIIFLHYIWEAPLEAIIVFCFLCWIIGALPTICSYAIFLLFIPLQIVFSQKFSRYRETTIAYAEKRIHAFSELIDGCQVIKMYNWEKPMEERVLQMRRLELASIWRTSFLRALNMSIFFASMSLLGISIFGSAWLLNIRLKATDIFIALAFYGKIRTPVTLFLPTGIEKLSEIRIVFKRIDAFMQLTTAAPQKTTRVPGNSLQRDKGTILMQDASFSWYDNDACLSSLNISVEAGTLVGVVGPTGSGKSSLLAAIMGELNLMNGELYVNDSSFSYAAQSAWILADTIRANILLGKSFNEYYYMKVLQACCLDVDLSTFGSEGDLTMIGEKAINLSGGQKARIALARALYTDADIYLLDDPLAAVDRTVATQIYNKCIGPQGLLSGKTRLLVTHQTEFLTESHQIIFLNGGHIRTHGQLDELSVEYQNILQTDDEEKEKPKETVLISMLNLGQSTVDTHPLIEDELRDSGTVSWSIWSSLLTTSSFGYFGLGLLVVLLLAGEVLYDGTNYWLSRQSGRSYTDEEHLSVLVYKYLTLALITLVVAIVRASCFFYLILKGSNSLHNNMLSGLLGTSMRFFESNPKERIINRASKDQQIIDEILPVTLFDAIQILMIIFGSVIIIGILIPWVLLLLVPLIPTFWILRRTYLRSSHQLKRLESVSRSPVYGLFTSSLDGLISIRAFQVTDDFFQSLMSKIDTNSRAYINLISVTYWFSLRLDLVTILFASATTILVVILHNQMSETELALSLFYAVSMSGWLPWGVRQFAEAENLIISAERIDEYVRLSREEDNGGSQGLIQTPADWPKRGAIEFRNYSLRYRSGIEPSLKAITFTVMPGEKIGIIGRTGAGKSSLFQGLLRIVDRSCVDGEIVIDDINISRITLAQLRSRVSLIPQSPVIFSGTLRYNLDPSNHYSDEECWIALETVQLKQIIYTHPAGLLLPVAELGTNFSVGQRQLICVARAILRHSQILLIDEATANIDKHTDTLLQAVISKIFKDQTVLTIAHRLNTVVSSDRLLLLDKGTIADFNVPDKILSQHQLS